MCTSLRNFCCRQLQKKQNIFDPPWLFFFFSFFATLPDFVGFTFTSFKYDWKEFWSQPKHACKWQLQSTLHCITVPNMTLKVTKGYIKLYCYIFCQKLNFAINFHKLFDDFSRARPAKSASISVKLMALSMYSET